VLDIFPTISRSDWLSNTAQWILVKEVRGMYGFVHWIRSKYQETYLLEWIHWAFISVYNMLRSDVQSALHCAIVWLFAVSLVVYWWNLYIYLYKFDVLVLEWSARGFCFQVYFSIYFNWGEIFLHNYTWLWSRKSQNFCACNPFVYIA
jgi:hypothetical protein